MTPEGLVKKKLRAYLDMLGAYYFMPVQMGYGATTVDFLVCIDGKFHAIETKRQGVTKLTLRQGSVLDKVKKAGGEAWLVTLNEAGELQWIAQ